MSLINAESNKFSLLISKVIFSIFYSCKIFASYVMSNFGLLFVESSTGPLGKGVERFNQPISTRHGAAI